MIQPPDQRVLQFFSKKIQFNFIQNLVFSGYFEDNHSICSIQSLISVSIIQISTFRQLMKKPASIHVRNSLISFSLFGFLFSHCVLRSWRGSKGQSPWLGLRNISIKLLY
ncbi:hypothetical protein Hanom_Chr16g01514851 [Helianthus anomalus]